jgi:hypothetical protein
VFSHLHAFIHPLPKPQPKKSSDILTGFLFFFGCENIGTLFNRILYQFPHTLLILMEKPRTSAPFYFLSYFLQGKKIRHKINPPTNAKDE